MTSKLSSDSYVYCHQYSTGVFLKWVDAKNLPEPIFNIHHKFMSSVPHTYYRLTMHAWNFLKLRDWFCSFCTHVHTVWVTTFFFFFKNVTPIKLFSPCSTDFAMETTVSSTDVETMIMWLKTIDHLCSNTAVFAKLHLNYGLHSPIILYVHLLLKII